MKKVLFISYYYPPLGGIGSIRTLEFTRNLPSSGWLPFVITTKKRNFAVDDGLVGKIPTEIEIFRTKSFEPGTFVKKIVSRRKDDSGENRNRVIIHEKPLEGNTFLRFLQKQARNWLYIPDSLNGWIPYVVRMGKEIIRKEGIDVIFSTSSPFSAHVAGLVLHEETGVPWVAEFRDLWTASHLPTGHARLRQWIDRFIERNILDDADIVVTVSKTWSKSLQDASNLKNNIDVRVITNGFDGGDFPGTSPVVTGSFDIVHVGTITWEKSTFAFLKSYRRFLDDNSIKPGESKTVFVGLEDFRVKEWVRKLELTDYCKFTGFVDHVKAVEYQKKAVLLLLCVDDAPGAEGFLPGKMFEYLGARKPILSLIPFDTEVYDIMLETGAGILVDEKNRIDRGARLLKNLYNVFKKDGNVAYKGKLEEIIKYERKRQAESLAGVLDDLVDTGRKK